MATLTTQVINRAGLAPTTVTAAGGGDAMSCGSGMFLYVKNGSGGALTVTLAIPAAITAAPNLAITNTVVSVVQTGLGFTLIGPILPQFYQDPTTGLCTITYSGVTSLTVAAIQLSQP